MTNVLSASANEYLYNHPELQSIIKDFVTAVLNNKPTNLLTFAQEYFGGKSNETTNTTTTTTTE